MSTSSKPAFATILPRFGAARVVAFALLTVLAMLVLPGNAQADSPRVLPLDGPVVRAFDPPLKRWLSGHRGVDLGGSAGDPVRAAADGTVSFVGTIAGTTSVSVRHSDGRRTTYQPVDPLVTKDQRVSAGDTIGRLLPGHCEQACLHWGLIEGDNYLDPLDWLGSGSRERVRLVPNGTVLRPVPSRAPVPQAGGSTSDAAQTVTPSGAVMPVIAPVTSPFGPRTNPVRGTSELHDGIDFGAACGTPVRASWAGTVSYAATMGGYGNRVMIDHGSNGQTALATSYSHLSDAGTGMVTVGQQVSAGQIVGLVGTTGLSTGCHLHYSVHQQGISVNPAPYLG
ncbi:M23 family metallopeptidase [Propionibacterium sp.]|uniref:M23 family metallopeptidase n=1 Tax=Propionibacterium sp. TaxID=1977903 RepID=UPI0039E7A47E